jgi:hypothetical protein
VYSTIRSNPKPKIKSASEYLCSLGCVAIE